MRMSDKRVKAQLHTASCISSKILKDPRQIEAIVEVEGVGRLVLNVDGGGGYSLRAYPENADDTGRDLLLVGVMHPYGIEAIHP